jgi:hypothetical protein
MPPNGNARALLTCRIGAARLGATRIGFTPQDTMSGNTSPFYAWKMQRGTPDKEPGGADPTWTKQK